MKRLICLLAPLLAAIVVAPPALAAGDPDKAKGLIAETCAQCHPVPGFDSDPSAAMLQAPSFRAIAQDPGTYPAKRLTEFLRQPHWPMVSLVLSRRDIEDLLAFIATLREN